MDGTTFEDRIFALTEVYVCAKNFRNYDRWVKERDLRRDAVTRLELEQALWSAVAACETTLARPHLAEVVS